MSEPLRLKVVLEGMAPSFLAASHGRTCPGTATALGVLTGEGEMRVTSVSEPPRVTELVRGRTCANCGEPPLEYVPIPSRRDVVVLCVPCMEHLLAEREPPSRMVVEAVEGLRDILQDTDVEEVDV